MTNRWIIRALVLALLALATSWIVENTTWEEVEEPPQLRGEAATDGYFGLRKVLAAAGSTVSVQPSLEPLPPTAATLLLDSALWDHFPERDARLRAWVEAGGHLAVPVNQLKNSGGLRWVPIDVSLSRSRPDARKHDTSARAAPTHPGGRADAPHELVESPGSPSAFEPGRRMRLEQGDVGWIMQPRRGVMPTWQLRDESGQVFALRVPVGRGAVTGIAMQGTLYWSAILQSDHALLDVAVLAPRPGEPVWIFRNDKEDPLPLWLWKRARPALLLALTAVALMIWRMLVRFGPLEGPADRTRRSIGEQVRGTAAFLAARDPGALHAAAFHAFEETARRRVPGFASADLDDRAEAIAARLAACGEPVDRSALRSALVPPAGAVRTDWRGAVRTLERTRRALSRAHPPATT